MRLFGKSDEERRIEAIQQEVKVLTSLMMKLAEIIERGEKFCHINSQDIIKLTQELNSHNEILNSHVRSLPQSTIATVRVPWGTTGQWGEFPMWAMFTENTVKAMGKQLQEWGL